MRPKYHPTSFFALSSVKNLYISITRTNTQNAIIKKKQVLVKRIKFIKGTYTSSPTALLTMYISIITTVIIQSTKAKYRRTPLAIMSPSFIFILSPLTKSRHIRFLLPCELLVIRSLDPFFIWDHSTN